jgi:riboflavin biosynthesis pyrimidine reductase
VGKIQSLRNRGAVVLETASEQVDLAVLLKTLSSMNLQTLMVEGGATLLSTLFHPKLVDRLVLQHLPVIFGGSDTPWMVGRAVD